MIVGWLCLVVSHCYIILLIHIACNQQEYHSCIFILERGIQQLEAQLAYITWLYYM